MKKRTGSKSRNFTKNLIELTVCVVSLVAATFAWLYNGKKGGTEELDFVTMNSTEMRISCDGEFYAYGIQLSMPSNLVLEPVSGSGLENTMYIPILPTGSDNAADAISWRSVSYDAAAEVNSFYYLQVYFQADAPGYVVLDSFSVLPAAAPEERQTQNYVNSAGQTVTVSGSVTRPIKAPPVYSFTSDVKPFTKDYIAAAARIGIVNRTNEAPTEALENCLLLPNDRYYLSVTAGVDASSYYFSMKENAGSVSGGSYYNGTEVQTYEAGGLTVITESSMQTREAPKLLELKQNGELYEGCLDLYLWVEGFDAEASDILAGGEILVSMNFAHQAAEEAES